MKMPRAPDSVLRVESEQDVHQAEKATERKSNQPIRSQENYARTNERKISAEQNLNGITEQRNRKTMFNNASDVFDKINDSFLPASYEPIKCFKKSFN